MSICTILVLVLCNIYQFPLETVVASRARVGQWKLALKPKEQPKTEGLVFTDPLKHWPALNNAQKISLTCDSFSCPALIKVWKILQT